MVTKKVILNVGVSLIIISSLSSIVLADAVPGTRIPLQLNEYELKTTMDILPIEWKPTHIRWILCDPSGKEIYFVENQLDSVKVKESGYEGTTHYTVWQITEDTGTMQIPAFAQAGEWTVKAMFYDSLLSIKLHKYTGVLYTIPVKQSSFLDNLNAPLYFILTLDFSPVLYYQHAYVINFPAIVLIILSFILIIVIIKTLLSVGGKK